jgi:hypothetical protein
MALYREKLWPTIWVPASFFPLVPALILIAAPFNVWVGVAAALIVYGGILIAVYSRAPLIEVTAEAFVYGDAMVEAEFIGNVSGFSGESARNERGVNLDARAWTKFKAFMQGVVKVEINDPSDPTPYWLVATRNPSGLAEALRQSRPRN